MWIKGQGHTKETCDKISATLKGRKKTAEAIKNASEAHKGFKQSEKQKEIARKMRVKSWMITAPNGQTTIISNLREFCKDKQPKSIRTDILRCVKENRPYKGFWFRRLG